jgi:cellulase/cellobiase CelA1
MPVAILRIARDRFFASLVQLTSNGVRALPSPSSGSSSSSSSTTSSTGELVSLTAGNDPDFRMESPTSSGGRSHSFGPGPGPTMHLTVLVNREYERLLGFTQREIQNRVESLGGKTIWR